MDGGGGPCRPRPPWPSSVPGSCGTHLRGPRANAVYVQWGAIRPVRRRRRSCQTAVPGGLSAQFWEWLFRQTEVQREPPHLPESVPPELRGVAGRPQEERGPPLLDVSFVVSCFVSSVGANWEVAGWPAGSHPSFGDEQCPGGGVAPAGFGPVDPYGAVLLPPLAFQRPAIFPPRTCAVPIIRPHVTAIKRVCVLL